MNILVTYMKPDTHNFDNGKAMSYQTVHLMRLDDVDVDVNFGSYFTSFKRRGQVIASFNNSYLINWVETHD